MPYLLTPTITSGPSHGFAPAIEAVLIRHDLRIVGQLPDVVDPVEQVETRIAVAPLTDDIRILLRNISHLRFDRADVIGLQQHVVAVVDVTGFHDSVILRHAQPVTVVRKRCHIARRMLDLHQPVLPVPRVCRDVAGRFFDRLLITVGVVGVRREAGDVFGVKKLIAVVVRECGDIAGDGIRLNQAITRQSLPAF